MAYDKTPTLFRSENHYQTLSGIETQKLYAMLTYKGYIAQIEIDTDAGLLYGRVLDIKDVVTFQGKTVEDARQAFEASVEDYLEFCAELGEEPDKPFSGKLPFRTTPDHHRKIFIAAKKTGKSINAWMEDVLTEAADRIIQA